MGTATLNISNSHPEYKCWKRRYGTKQWGDLGLGLVWLAGLPLELAGPEKSRYTLGNDAVELTF